MAEQELPPWLKEQVSRFQQIQQNLQAIMMQKQQVELEAVEIDRALEDLGKSGPEDTVYKSAGPLLIKAKRDDLNKELEEKKELAKTRLMVLSKQESRVKDNMKEVENKINQMLRGAQGNAGTTGSSGFAGGAGTQAQSPQ
jgi:prefoldin beta subunit